MTEQSEPASGISERRGGRGRRRKPRSRSRKVLLVAAWSTAAAVTLGGTGLAYAYFKLDGNGKSVDINKALGDERPENVDNGSLDILVLGSDSRDGANGRYGGGDEGARSDTAMVLHIHEGRKKASIVSIPRDTLITRPECATDDGGTDPGGERKMFNEAYSVGGPACAVKTVEKISGIRMDHYLEVDFSGFKDLIDLLDGVEITTDRAIKDKDSHLDLAAGTHQLNGEQALGLVRTRHGVGDGGDLGRIQLQQAFIKALIAQVGELGLLTSPTKLFSLADTATSSLTTDSELKSPKDLASFALGLKGIDAKNMNMITLPVVYDTIDPNRVVPLEKESQLVWDALRADRPIPAEATKDSAGDKGEAGTVVKDDDNTPE
ncbi:LCP family protein [Streptomyces sp. O3]